jgi:hypothetical protein
MIVPRIALAAAALLPVVLPAQSTASTEAPHHVVVGSSDEDYLRYLQTIREQTGTFFTNGVTDPHANDVQNALTFSRARYFGRGELTTGVTMVHELNRDLQADAWNVNLLVGFRLTHLRSSR